MQQDETLWKKNTWSLTLYEMSGIKASSKGKAQCHSLSVGHGMECDDTSWKRNSLTSCWSWNKMWWDHLKGENFTVTYILLFMWRDFKLTSLTSCTKCNITYNLLNIKWQPWGCVVTKVAVPQTFYWWCSVICCSKNYIITHSLVD